MASSEADDEADDSGALAAVGCLRAISTILESISSLPHLFIQIEPTLLPIMRRMLTSDGQGIYTHYSWIVGRHVCYLFFKMLLLSCLLLKKPNSKYVYKIFWDDANNV